MLQVKRRKRRCAICLCAQTDVGLRCHRTNGGAHRVPAHLPQGRRRARSRRSSLGAHGNAHEVRTESRQRAANVLRATYWRNCPPALGYSAHPVVCRGALAPLPGVQPSRNGRIRLNPRWECLWRDLNGPATAQSVAVMRSREDKSICRVSYNSGELKLVAGSDLSPQPQPRSHDIE